MGWAKVTAGHLAFPCRLWMVHTEDFIRPQAENESDFLYCREAVWRLRWWALGSLAGLGAGHSAEHMCCTCGAPVQGRPVWSLLWGWEGCVCLVTVLRLVRQRSAGVCDKWIMPVLAGRHVLEV